MHCCHPEITATGRVFSRFARLSQRRYRRKGLESTQRCMVEALRQIGVADATLLEVGCGVGYLHQTLLKDGAAQALGVDLSERMLEEARAAAQREGLAERTEYRLGDFVVLAPELPAADIVLLDKVVCCYPDAAALMQYALDKTQRAIALTYPRDHALNRAGVALGGWLLRLLRVAFRNYIHDPARIEAWITQRGLRKCYEHHSALWLTQVYVRE